MTEKRNHRGRAFAAAIAFVLGVNLWGCLVLLPRLAVEATSSWLSVCTILCPLPVLAIAVWKRSELALIVGFPGALLIPIAVPATSTSAHVFSPARFAIVSTSFLVFLFGAAALTSLRESRPPHSIRPLRSSLVAKTPHWRRQQRMYALLSLISLLFPFALLYHVNMAYTGAYSLQVNYPGRSAMVTVFLTLLVVGLWLLLFHYFFRSLMIDHRDNDKSLQTALAAARRRANQGRWPLLFYLGAGIVVASVTLWYLWKQ